MLTSSGHEEMVRRSPAVLSDSCPKRHKALKLETWKLHWHLFSPGSAARVGSAIQVSLRVLH